MSAQSFIATSDTVVEHLATQRANVKLSAVIASRWVELRSAWKRQANSRRLARSIAHLDDRLLADIGLRAEHLGFAERVARSRAKGVGSWAGS